MNEVNETLRSIRNSMEEHTLKSNQLNEVIDYLTNADIPEKYKECIMDCVLCKQAFHVHKVEKLYWVREGILDKYYSEDLD